jgi:hypothetical protein
VLEEIAFGGLRQREADERVPVEAAIKAFDCLLDDDSVYGRNGYRSALAGAIVGAGQVQAIERFRVSPTQAVTVACVGGTVYTIADPSSQTASDAVATSVAGGPHFGSTDDISMAQLGKYLYIGTNNVAYPMKRLDSSYALTSLEGIPKGATPTLGAYGALTWTAFTSLAAPTVSGCVSQDNSKSGMGSMDAAWRCFTKTDGGNDDPLSGAYVQYKLAANFDASADNWLAIGVSAHDGSNVNTGQQCEVFVTNDVSGSPGTWVSIGTTYDVPYVGGSPNLLYCDLRGLPSAVQTAVRYIKIVADGASGGKFMTYGYLFLPAPPLSNPQSYYVTFFNSTTGQESAPTDALVVTIKATDVVLPNYPDSFMDRGDPNSTTAQLDMLSSANHRIFNREAGKDWPQTASNIGAIVTVSGTTPAASTPDTVRLWKDTDTGRRLVGTKPYPGASSPYTVSDTEGIATLQNTLFKAGGTPPVCEALAARGGRLICGYQNTLYVSSFTPPGQITDPFPQFPAIALETADGYSFDISPTKVEQIQQIVDGDVLYIGTNQRVCSLNDLSAPIFGLPPAFYRMSGRGVMGRRSMIYADGPNGYGGLFWASGNGVYASMNRASMERATEVIYRFYRDWFLPDATTVLTYQDSKLYAFRGTRFIRLDFLTGRWTAGTLAHTVSDRAVWLEVGSAREEMWLLTSDRKIGRWQRECGRDMQVGTDTTTGSAPPSWIYSTGFSVPGQSTRLGRIYVDVDTAGEPLVLYAYKGANDATDQSRRLEFADGETVKKLLGDLRAQKWRLELQGVPQTRVRRLMWGFDPMDAEGA